MEENQIFKYGEYDLDKNTLIKLMLSNVDSYLTYHDVDPEYKNKFITTLGNIAAAIKNDQFTTNGFGKFTDYSNTLDMGDNVTLNALDYVNTIALGYSKKLESTVKKKQTEPEEDNLSEAFNFRKHGLQNHFIQQLNPSLLQSNIDPKEIGKELDNTISTWKNSFNSSSEAIQDLGNMLDSYITKESLKNLDYSQSFNDYDSYIRNVSNLREGLRDGNLNGVDKRLLTLLGLSGLENYFIEPTKKDDEEVVVDNENSINNNEEEVITKTPANESDFTVEKFWNNLNGYQKVQMGTAAADVVSAITAFAPGWGTVGSGVIGLGSTLTNLGNDLFHEDSTASVGEAFGNAGINLAMDAIGLVPGWGIGAKAKKMASILKGVAGTVILGFSAYGLYNAKNSFEKLMNNPDDMTVEDFLHLASGLQVLMLGAGGYRAAKRHISKNADLVELRSKTGKKVKITPELLDDIKAAKDYDALNAKFKEYTKGQELSLEFKTVKSSKPVKEWRTKFGVIPYRKTVKRTTEIETGPKIKTITHYLPEDERLDARLFRFINGEGWNVRSSDPELRNTTSQVDATPPVRTSSENVETNVRTNTETNTETNVNPTNTPATEIKPDIKPDITPSIRKTKKAKLSKLSKRTKIPEQIKQDLKQLETQNDLFKNELAERVSKGELNPSEAYKRVRDYLKKKGFEEKDIIEWLRNKNAYKQGGIIKAQEGTKFYGTGYTLTPWETLYETNQIQGTLGGNSYRSTSGLTNKTTASLEDLLDLNTYASRYRPYTVDEAGMSNRISDFLQLISDLRNSNKELTFDDFLLSYNQNIDDIYKDKRDFGYKVGEYNDPENIKKFNSRHRALYRSANSDNGVYGYDDELEHINGTTTLARGVDITDNDLEIDLSKLDENTRSWIGNRRLFKAKDGRYYVLNTSNASPDTPASTESESKQEDKKEDKKGNEGTARGLETPKPPKLEKPERPNDPFFTWDKALAGLNYVRALKHNKRSLDLANKLPTLLYDPVEHHRSIYGNLRAITEGQRAAGKVISKSMLPLTSDGNLQTAARLDALNLANEYILEGQKMDDEAMRKSLELAWLQKKANKENRYNIAMKNRENMHQVQLERLQAKINKNRADYESGTNLINEIRTWITSKHKADKAKKDALYNRNLQSYIFNTPEEYIPGWGPYYEQIWNKNKEGESLTDKERSVLTQMQGVLTDAYYNDLYGGADFLASPINKPAWSMDFSGIKLKNGGTITKDMVKTIVLYLKESNNNYHKDIDRSIKGLYNHIKLLRKK